MARYCFHAYSGICFAEDFEVWDLPDLEAARGAASQVANHFRACLPRHLRQETLTIQIEEEAGQGHASMYFLGRERY